MYTRKMLSIATATAIVSVGAMAFDTNENADVINTAGKALASYNYFYFKTADGNSGENVPKNSGEEVRKRSNSTYSDLRNDASVIQKKGPGALGDALIFPAFFAGGETKDGVSNWESTFSVINTSDRAVIAKVVLYSRVNSQELRDFNIYLSAHDVFRATLKDGKIHSEDDSTVAYNKNMKNASVRTSNPKFGEKNHDTMAYDPKIDEYKYIDSVTMASKDNPLDMYVDVAEENKDSDPDASANGLGLHLTNKSKSADFEHTGYIIVYAMAEATSATYHNKHNELWQDYRHLLDTCRNTDVKNGFLEEWRDGIQNGIYINKSLSLPNVAQDAIGREELYGQELPGVCNTVYNSTLYGEDTPAEENEVTFQSPSASLTGSILVSHDNSDGKGSRDMLLKAYALDNFSVAGQMFLWTEGEFANIQDRRLTYDDTANRVKYDRDGILKDADVFNLQNTYYEYMDSKLNDDNSSNSLLLVTQPYKRVLVDLGESQNTWMNIGDRSRNNGLDEYGQFDLKLKIYNDSERNYIPQIGGFTVSPATAGATSGIPYELSIFSPLQNMSTKDRQELYDHYPKGYVYIEYNQGDLPGIVTQMAATVKKDGTAETNWIYPFSTYRIDRSQ